MLTSPLTWSYFPSHLKDLMGKQGLSRFLMAAGQSKHIPVRGKQFLRTPQSPGEDITSSTQPASAPRTHSSLWFPSSVLGTRNWACLPHAFPFSLRSRSGPRRCVSGQHGHEAKSPGSGPKSDRLQAFHTRPEQAGQSP